MGANQKLPFLFFAFRRRGRGRSRAKKWKEVFGFARASPRARLGRLSARVERTKKSQATTRSRAYESVAPRLEIGSSGAVYSHKGQNSALLQSFVRFVRPERCFALAKLRGGGYDQILRRQNLSCGPQRRGPGRFPNMKICGIISIWRTRSEAFSDG